MNDFFLKRLEGCLFIGISRRKAECKRDAVAVKEQSHLNDWIGTVLLAVTVLPEVVLFLNFKEVVGAVVVKDAIVSLGKLKTILVEF